MDRDAVAALITELVALRAPASLESELDDWLARRLAPVGALVPDDVGNRVLRIEGRGPGTVALTAHKDEIAAVVKRVGDDGRLRCLPHGGIEPWIWGEAPVDVIGDAGEARGVLSFGSRHVNRATPSHSTRKEPIGWSDAWVETKQSPDALAALGIRPGSLVVLGAARRQPLRFGADDAWIATPFLDDRIAVAVLVLLAERLSAPARTVELVFTAQEEVGAYGARHYAQRAGSVEELIAVEIAPAAEEYGVVVDASPVVIRGDSRGVLDRGIALAFDAAAQAEGVTLQHAMLETYGSDASNALAGGHTGRTACIAIATENSHGVEIAHLDAVDALVRTLARYLA